MPYCYIGTLMVKSRQAIFVVALVIASALWTVPCFGLDVPPLEGRVNDYANMLSPETRNHLDSILQQLEDNESTQIVVLTIASLQGDSLEDFSIRVAEQWKMGQKGLDNGAILLIAKQDRKVRIEVGYGLEGRLTDLISGRIIRNVILPEFKSGRMDQGVIKGVNAMIAAVKGEFESTPPPRSANKRGSGDAIFLLIVVFVIFISRIGSRKPFLGAISGGVAAPVLGAIAGSGLLIALFLIPIGLLVGLFLSSLGLTSTGRGGWHSGFGGYWGGGLGGGGFSGGGFSGGGGGFGGGGASGSW
ncbi:conserved membrane hypothetical protein [uncultured Desulfobacterium sp.]|uniref:TPM domain-containing protein n=1 Tax=uncultured Desulfobacterium sp. TaxID=201089 RepID=A0A445MS97_9BACT|nr:conserved membrane hypothetical protein [uncultured Desulfobacterium sp.]